MTVHGGRVRCGINNKRFHSILGVWYGLVLDIGMVCVACMYTVCMMCAIRVAILMTRAATSVSFAFNSNIRNTT